MGVDRQRPWAALRSAQDERCLSNHSGTTSRTPGNSPSCASTAAASIIAKVSRDKIMTTAARRYRGYGFQRHKGYGTDEHWAALRRLGPSAYHRHSFTGVAAPWVAIVPSSARANSSRPSAELRESNEPAHHTTAWCWPGASAPPSSR